MSGVARHPLGAALTLEQLDTDPHGPLAALREQEPVSWVPVLDGWLVTRRDLCIEVMRDAGPFTVDDPRFSTAQVVGPSMLSLDGDEHKRHRDPFAFALRGPEVRERLHADRGRGGAAGSCGTSRRRGGPRVRRDLAGPLAVNVVADALDLLDTEPGDVLGWYDEIVAAVDRVSAGGEVGRGCPGRLRGARAVTSAGPSTTAMGCSPRRPPRSRRPRWSRTRR